MKTNKLSNRRKHRIAGSYLIATLFILVGLLLMGKNFNLIDIQVYSALVSWQMLLIVLGLFSILNRHLGGGVILTGIGAYFLLPKLGWMSIDAQTLLLPGLLILIGIMVILKIKRTKSCIEKQHVNIPHTSADGVINSDSSFGSIQQTVMDEVFRGGTIKTTFGGVVIDLRRTTLPEGETVLYIECNFGGIELHTPSHWNIRTELRPFIGGVEDSRYTIGTAIDTSRTLVIKGNISFGGMEIKN